MKAVLQRVKNAGVSVDGQLAGECGKGLCILFGAEAGDTRADAELLAAKIVRLRIFSDANGKMNLSLKDIDGDVLVVSNFTLLADYRHGNRPDYLGAAPPDIANGLYGYFVDLLKAEIGQVGTGVFGAHMELSIINDGPVTIVMDSNVLKKKGGE